MKKFLKIAAGALLVLIGVVVIGGFLMPGQVQLERSTVINAPPEAVFPHVNDLRKWDEWSPWAKIDPNMKSTFEGPEAGVGQINRWESDHKDVGSGTQTITESVENRLVATALDFGDMGTGTARIELEPADGATKVTWGFQTDLGNNPIARWFGPMIKSSVEESYDEGLANLKTLSEGG